MLKFWPSVDARSRTAIALGQFCGKLNLSKFPKRDGLSSLALERNQFFPRLIGRTFPLALQRVTVKMTDDRCEFVKATDPVISAGPASSNGFALVDASDFEKLCN